MWSQRNGNCMASRDDIFIKLWRLVSHCSPLKSYVCQSNHMSVFPSHVTLSFECHAFPADTFIFTLFFFSDFIRTLLFVFILTCSLFSFSHHFFPVSGMFSQLICWFLASSLVPFFPHLPRWHFQGLQYLIQFDTRAPQVRQWIKCQVNINIDKIWFLISSSSIKFTLMSLLGCCETTEWSGHVHGPWE